MSNQSYNHDFIYMNRPLAGKHYEADDARAAEARRKWDEEEKNCRCFQCRPEKPKIQE